MSAPGTTTTPSPATPPSPAAAPGSPARGLASGRAWTAEELSNPHARGDKPEKVRAMFAAIARSYDLNNRLHSLWMDQAWRRYAVRAARVRVGDEALDCACGTGDLTRLLARSGAKRVVGLDFTAEMLEIARVKTPARPARGTGTGGAAIEYVQGDAMSLPFGAETFDVVTIAFGVRNVSEPARALREFRRVLRPGGRLVVLEFDRPRVPVLGALAEFYTRRVMPVTATWISGDRSGAYAYLPRSVATFLSREELGEAIRGAGFAGVTCAPLTMGVCVCYTGTAA